MALDGSGRIARPVNVVRIARGQEPPIYSNHVLVEALQPGGVRVTGSSNKQGYVTYLAPPQFGSFDPAIRVAREWAEEHGIDIIHLVARNLS